MSIGIWQVALLLVVVLVLFGGGRLPGLMGDLAKGIKSFRTGLRDDAIVAETAPPATVAKHDESVRS